MPTSSPHSAYLSSYVQIANNAELFSQIKSVLLESGATAAGCKLTTFSTTDVIGAAMFYTDLGIAGTATAFVCGLPESQAWTVSSVDTGAGSWSNTIYINDGSTSNAASYGGGNAAADDEIRLAAPTSAARVAFLSIGALAGGTWVWEYSPDGTSWTDSGYGPLSTLTNYTLAATTTYCYLRVRCTIAGAGITIREMGGGSSSFLTRSIASSAGASCTSIPTGCTSTLYLQEGTSTKVMCTYITFKKNVWP